MAAIKTLMLTASRTAPIPVPMQTKVVILREEARMMLMLHIQKMETFMLKLWIVWLVNLKQR